MKLYVYRVYDLQGKLRNQGYFYAKSRDTMRARIAREFVGYETTVSETTEKPTQLIGANGNPVKGGIHLNETPKFIGRVLSLGTDPPTWFNADGGFSTFNKNTGKLYSKKRRY